MFEDRHVEAAVREVAANHTEMRPKEPSVDPEDWHERGAKDKPGRS
jgi:hypothetical protein